MAAKKKKGKHNEVGKLHEMLLANGEAKIEGPRKKSWTQHDIKNIKPLTDNQHEMFRCFFDGGHICAHGSAGTGKTFLALYLALSEVLNPTTPQDKIIIVRSTVTTRDMGFMPGDLNEKVSFYETPYKDILSELFRKSATYDNMKEAGLLYFMPTSFIRGITWNDAIVVVDEGQNMTFHEINSIMTRLGENAKVIFTGDLPQTDLRKNKTDVSGMKDFINIACNMPAFSCIQFDTNDIVRSQFVKDWIMAAEGIL